MFLFTLSFFSQIVPHLTLHVQCEVKACGMSDLFDLALPEYASKHKDHYEEHMPNSLIWDPWTSWYFSFLKNIIYFVVVHMFPHDNLRTFHKIQGQSVGDNQTRACLPSQPTQGSCVLHALNKLCWCSVFGCCCCCCCCCCCLVRLLLSSGCFAICLTQCYLLGVKVEQEAQTATVPRRTFDGYGHAGHRGGC